MGHGHNFPHREQEFYNRTSSILPTADGREQTVIPINHCNPQRSCQRHSLSPQRRDGRGKGNINRAWWVQPPQTPSPHILQSDRMSPWRGKTDEINPKTSGCEDKLFPGCWCLHTDNNNNRRKKMPKSRFVSALFLLV